MRERSTAEAAKVLNLHQPNLQRLIREGRIPFPPLRRIGGVKVRLWSSEDIHRARKALMKPRPGRVRRGKKRAHRKPGRKEAQHG